LKKLKKNVLNNKYLKKTKTFTYFFPDAPLCARDGREQCREHCHPRCARPHQRPPLKQVCLQIKFLNFLF
jgi:hypothetical protein